jgi:hypothetical protein
MSRDIGAVLSGAIHDELVTLTNSGAQVLVQALDRREWASVTFTGARHRVRATIDGAGAAGAAGDFLDALPDLEFQIPGHIVADIALLVEARRDGGDHAMLELEALTIKDC